MISAHTVCMKNKIEVTFQFNSVYPAGLTLDLAARQTTGSC